MGSVPKSVFPVKKPADIVALLNLECIVFAGGLAQTGNLLINPAECYLKHYLLDMLKGTVDIKISPSANNQIQLLGASAFAWEKLGNVGKTSADSLAR